MEGQHNLFITAEAAAEIKRQLINRGTPDGYVRVGVKGGGCSGLSYIFQFETDQPQDKDLMFDSYGVNIIVDRKSIIYLSGCTLDWEKTLMRQGFKFINPNETTRCGCGTSFSVF